MEDRVEIKGALADELKLFNSELEALRKRAQILKNAKESAMLSAVFEQIGIRPGVTVKYRGMLCKLGRVEVSDWTSSVHVTLYGYRKTKHGWHSRESYIGSLREVELVPTQAEETENT